MFDILYTLISEDRSRYIIECCRENKEPQKLSRKDHKNKNDIELESDEQINKLGLNFDNSSVIS